MPYWKLYYHLVWGTFERHPLMTPEREVIIRTSLYRTANELDLVLHAIGNVADHIHLVVSVPPVVSIAASVKRLKGASSRAVSLCATAEPPFRWQEGYGVLSIGERSLPTVIAYVRHQPQHHSSRTTLAGFEMTTLEDVRQSSSDDLVKT